MKFEYDLEATENVLQHKPECKFKCRSFFKINALTYLIDGSIINEMAKKKKKKRKEMEMCAR